MPSPSQIARSTVADLLEAAITEIGQAVWIKKFSEATNVVDIHNDIKQKLEMRNAKGYTLKSANLMVWEVRIGMKGKPAYGLSLQEALDKAKESLR